MKRGRGRPPVYENATQQPVLVALRVPRALEARLRQEASEGGRTMTDILLQALAFRWEHASAVEELALARQQLSQLQREHNALQGRHKRLRADFERIQEQHKALKRDHTRLTADFAHVQRELDEAQNIAWYKDLVRRRISSLLSPEETISEEVRRELIKVSHPDKWSQGQLATELAHEIMVILTK